ncbi:hypothetical protein [Paracoccus chinensis]|uniref:Uncharacterized protein n=1 Tax=Paracoccus chinensis TaxID=525640 RepID=A0A1G9JUG2_9RHOB|nr:hypothetical protein [Paracoccus chinensis]SDL41131.1 hypothetical protein SAMN04487971_11052 [Paracoccus chinensis]
MTGIADGYRLACFCVAAVLPAMAAVAAPPQGVTLKGHSVRIAELPIQSLRNLRRLETGEGQSLVAVDTGGRMTVMGTEGHALATDAGRVADAALLQLGDDARPQSYAMWVGPRGLGVVRLDAGKAEAALLPASGSGEIGEMGATRLAAARDRAGDALILVGTIGGQLSALSVRPQGESLGLESAGHWSVEGAVKAMTARGSRAYILATTGLWSLDLSAENPEPVLEAAGRSGCLDASRDIGGLALMEEGPRSIVAVAQPDIQRIVAYESGPGPDACLGFVHVVHASDPEGMDTVVPTGMVGGAGASLLVSDADRPEVVGVPHLPAAFSVPPETLTTLAAGQ